jgi:signal transduction histidine kinase
MKSLLSKILIWSLSTLVLSFVAFVAISFSITTRMSESQDLLGSLTKMQAYGALDAYQRGGSRQLQSYLKLLQEYLQLNAAYHLVDNQGRDLLTGSEMASLLDEARTIHRLLAPFRERLVIATPLPDRRFTFLLVTQPPVKFKDFLPYYLLIVLVVGILCYLLAMHLITPLKGLARTVENFGRGDLASRFQSMRKDEIGDLGHAYNEMADRIQLLLQAQRRLLQDVSHELRSPLARMGFAFELIKSPETREQGLDQVRQELDRLISLISALLQISRGEMDFSQLNLGEVSLGGLLQEIVSRCSIEADVRQCRISRNGADVIVLGDREVLDHAIENVLRNAIHYSPPESVIEITLNSGDRIATITVRDYGPGIPEQFLEPIFKPFYRLDSSHSGGSVGLGLSIAQRALILHKGRIYASNAFPGLQVVMEIPLMETGR